MNNKQCKSAAALSTGCTQPTTQAASDGSGSAQASADVLLEAAIAVAACRLGHAKTEEEKTDAWRELSSLHIQRSKEQIARMERDRGLRK